MEEELCPQQSKSVELTEASLSYLNTTRKWGIFLSIVGFIFTGLILLIAIIVATSFSFIESALPVSGFSLFLIYIAIAILYFFPVLFLYKFSVNTKIAIDSRSSSHAEIGFKNLKSMFKYIGILTIAILTIYPIAIVAAVILAVNGNM